MESWCSHVTSLPSGFKIVISIACHSSGIFLACLCTQGALAHYPGLAPSQDSVELLLCEPKMPNCCPLLLSINRSVCPLVVVAGPVH